MLSFLMFSYDACRVPNCNTVRWDILGDNATSAYNGVVSYSDAGQDYAACSYPYPLADCYFFKCCFQILSIVMGRCGDQRSRAQLSVVSNFNTAMAKEFCKAVDCTIIANRYLSIKTCSDIYVVLYKALRSDFDL
jgi:hypothetical protein